MSQASVKTPTKATLKVGNEGSNEKKKKKNHIVKKCSFTGKKVKENIRLIFESEKYIASLPFFLEIKNWETKINLH